MTNKLTAKAREEEEVDSSSLTKKRPTSKI